MTDTFTTEDLADVAQVSTATIRRWVLAGALPGGPVGSGVHRSFVYHDLRTAAALGIIAEAVGRLSGQRSALPGKIAADFVRLFPDAHHEVVIVPVTGNVKLGVDLAGVDDRIATLDEP